MNEQLLHDLKSLDKILAEVKEFGLSHLDNLSDIQTSVKNINRDFPDLPTIGLGTSAAQEYFKQHIYQNIVSSAGSRYWGFVTGGSTPAAIAGDWLTTVFDQNAQNSTGVGDASAVLEQHTIKLLLQLFDLPEDFVGGTVTGATMSNFTGLAVARQWLGQQLGYDIARNGIQGGLKIYTATPHSSAIKSLSMLGVGSTNVQFVPTLPGREAMDIDALTTLLENNPSEPFILISSGGTVNTVDYDDMAATAELKKQYKFWWHIDAAFGAFAACSTNYKYLLKVWEKADSITVDAHKWLNVPYDSAVTFTRKEHLHLHLQTFQNSNAPYLGDPLKDFNYLNFGPENSRRFRALPIWFTLMAYGKKGYQQIVDNNIQLAQLLGEKISGLEGYQLSAPVRLNTVCFTVVDQQPAERIKAILAVLNSRGKLFITPTVYNGQTCLRAALVNWRTTKADIEIAIEELRLAYQQTIQHKTLNTVHS